MGLTTINGTEQPSHKLSLFVLHAARNCAIRALQILRQQGVGLKNPNLSFCGDVIAAGMAEYWEKGGKCHGYHELFFNGLFIVLYGGIENKAVGILNRVKAYYN